MLPRLLSLFLIFVVDGHPDKLVGDEIGNCAWNVDKFGSGGSNIINSSEVQPDRSAASDDGRLPEPIKLNDVLILSISSNCTGTICLYKDKKTIIITKYIES